MSDGPESKSPGRFSCSSFCKNPPVTFRRPSGGVPPFPAVPFHPGSAVHPKPRPADSPGISCCSKTHRTCCPAPQRQPWASWAGVPVSRVREPAPPKRRRPSSRPYPWGRWSLPGDRTATPRSRTAQSPLGAQLLQPLCHGDHRFIPPCASVKTRCGSLPAQRRKAPSSFRGPLYQYGKKIAREDPAALMHGGVLHLNL